jgi:2'-5' RNA ligase
MEQPLCFPLSRAFIAIPLEGEARRIFGELQMRLHGYEKIFRLQNPETPHLTLQYWHELMDIEYHQVLKQAEKIVSGRSPFTLRVTGADTFGNRVLFLAIAFSDELARLKKACPWPNVRHAEEDCRTRFETPLGAARLKTPQHDLRRSVSKHVASGFLPHITLARMKTPEGFIVHKKKIMKQFRDASFECSADRLRLYAEIEGEQQTPIRDFLFAE